MIGAIVLAGGRGSRLGGVDKAALLHGGTPLLDRLLAALEDIDTVVVGPPRLGVRTVQESPPFAGPAAAVVTGLAALPAADEVLLLAVDVPRAAEALPSLLAAGPTRDGVVAVDADGREQWLLGRYRAAAIRDRGDDWAGASLRALLGVLELDHLRLPPGVEVDVDTVADARAAGVRLPEEDAMSDDVDETLAKWWESLVEALGLPAVPADRGAILGLAGEAAHGVVRPAAPITTFLAGYAAGLAGGGADEVQAALARARATIPPEQ